MSQRCDALKIVPCNIAVSSVLSFLTLERVSFAILMSFSAVLMASRAAAWLPAAFTRASVILTMTSDTALAFALKTEKRKNILVLQTTVVLRWITLFSG